MEVGFTLTNHPKPLTEQLNNLGLSSDKQSECDVLFGDTFRRVTNVFNPKILLAANQEIDSDVDFFSDPSDVNFFSDPNELKGKARMGDRESKIVQSAIYLKNNEQYNYQYILASNLNEIEFDENCKIKNQDYFTRNIVNCELNSALFELVKNGIESMAKNSNWKNRIISFPTINIIRYPITKDNDLSGLPWHRDFMGDTTMTVLMNPKTYDSYVGGGLRTAESNNKPEMINKFGFVECPHKKETEQLHEYKQNSGFLFTNCENLLHQAQEAKIQAASTTNTQAMFEKRLFTIFANTNKPKPSSIGVPVFV